MMARYGAWANQRLVTSCQNLSTENYHADRNAFFKSIHGTLTHILVADRVWFGRITGIDDLAAQLFDTFDGLTAARLSEDQRIIDIIDDMDKEDIVGDLSYTPITDPTPMNTPMPLILTHVFNHATHHRGQVHTLLSQIPSDPPPLDLIYYLSEV